MTDYSFLDDYQRKAGKFAVYPHVGENVCYPVVLLNAEAREAAQATTDDEFNAEIADMLWGCQQVCTEVNQPLFKAVEVFQGKSSHDYGIMTFSMAAYRLNEPASKYFRDNGKCNVDKFVDEMLFLVGFIVCEIESMLEDSHSLQDLCNQNLAKLESRKERNVLHGSGGDR